jgi:RND family efflux transporter MFP subunit
LPEFADKCRRAGSDIKVGSIDELKGRPMDRMLLPRLSWIRNGFALGIGLTILAATPLPAGAQATAAPPAQACGRRCVLVGVMRVTNATYAPKVALTGSIEPKFSSNIGFRVTGRIDQRFANVGDHVEPDQVLARLDAREQMANLDAAKAVLLSAQALLTQATANFDRQAELLKNGYATRQIYDQAQQQLRTQQAAVDSAKAAVGTAEEQLGYTALKAGVAGVITARSAETGQVVQAGQTVFTVAQDGARDAVFDVYEALLTDHASPKVQVFLQTDPGVTTTGTVREIAPTVDTASDTVKVKIALEQVPAQMSLGTAIVGIATFAPRRAIALPRGALFRWHDSPAVWLLDPESRTVNPKVITIDRYVGNELVLSDGVAPGDTVVVAGVQFLHPGQIVDVAKSDQMAMMPTRTPPSAITAITQSAMTKAP